jgi:ENTH domain
MSFNGLALRAKIHNEGTEAEKRLATLLFDDGIQVLSTFEMNQIASLSYGDETCEQIFDLLEEVMAHPMQFTVLAVQKSVVIAKHLLIYGSEKCVNSCWGLGSYVEKLCEFNTVLLAQQQQGLGSWWQSVKGGSVDMGFPVRESAQVLCKLMADSARIQQLRNDNADPNSLVPVGSAEKLGFVSDEVRHYMLQKRMKEHMLVTTRSNLKKGDSGFGSGFNAANGQTVVGAAHSIEEMMARAEREARKFKETGPIHYKPKPVEPEEKQVPPPAAPLVVDLLDFNDPAPTSAPAAPTVDLLGFGGAEPALTPAPLLDIFAPTPTTVDLIGGGLATEDLLGGATPAADVYGADLLATTEPSVQKTSDLMNLMTLSEPTQKVQNVGFSSMPVPELTFSASSNKKPSVMASNADRFAALDELAPPDGALLGSNRLLEKAAEDRILGFTPSAPPLPAEFPPPPPPSMYNGDLGITTIGGITGGIGVMGMHPSPVPTHQPPPPPTYDDALDITPMGGVSGMAGMHGGLGGHGAVLPSAPLPTYATPTPLIFGDAYNTMEPMGGARDVMGVGGLSMMGTESYTGAHAVMGGAQMSSYGHLPPPPSDLPPPPPSELPPPPPPDEPITIVVAAKFGNIDDEDSGFLMGGSSGTGL